MAASGPDDGICARRIGEQQLLQTYAVRQLIADFLLPCPLITAELTLYSRSRGEVTADHRRVDSFGRQRVHESTGIAREQHSITVRARQRPRNGQRKGPKISSIGFACEHL